MRVLGILRTGWENTSWFFKGVLGESAYERYVDYHRRTDCQLPLMTEREFWRDQTDRQESNPQGRCC